MSYSYTEKRRIRKNFGRLPKVMRLPKLIETQLNSYAEFLQSDVPADKRNKQGLEEVCLLYTSPSPRDQRGSRMPSSA